MTLDSLLVISPQTTIGASTGYADTCVFSSFDEHNVPIFFYFYIVSELYYIIHN